MAEAWKCYDGVADHPKKNSFTCEYPPTARLARLHRVVDAACDSRQCALRAGTAKISIGRREILKVGTGLGVAQQICATSRLDSQVYRNTAGVIAGSPSSDIRYFAARDACWQAMPISILGRIAYIIQGIRRFVSAM
jgi:hypothetical protein